jgi:hypothetical protein
VTPVMERCPCSWPIAECLEHSAPSAPVDDADGLAQPPAVPTILILAGAIVVLDLAVVVGLAVCAVKAAEWLLGLLG